jgi:hypothetical protein
MPQELKGRLTVLCPSCRQQAPVKVGLELQWHCPHRIITLRQSPTRRFPTLGNDRVDHRSHEGSESHVTTL